MNTNTGSFDYRSPGPDAVDNRWASFEQTYDHNGKRKMECTFRVISDLVDEYKNGGAIPVDNCPTASIRVSA